MNKEEYRKYFDKKKFEEINFEDFITCKNAFKVFCDDIFPNESLYFRPIIKEPKEVFPKVFKATGGYHFEITKELQLRVFNNDDLAITLVRSSKTTPEWSEIDLKALEDAIAELKRLKAKENEDSYT